MDFATIATVHAPTPYQVATWLDLLAEAEPEPEPRPKPETVAELDFDD